MARSRDIWEAVYWACGIRRVERTLSVVAKFRITFPQTQAERTVDVILTPDAARRMGQHLIDQADLVEERQAQGLCYLRPIGIDERN